MSDSGKEAPDKGKNALLNDLLKACALAIITGLIGTYLSVVFSPADFEIYATYPKLPDLDIGFKESIDENHLKDYSAIKNSDGIYFSLADTRIKVKDTNPISQFWPVWPNPKKYPHFIYLNCSTKLPGIEILFGNLQNQTPFESNITVKLSPNVTQGENEVKICALGGDGKSHYCPIHIKIVKTSPPEERSSNSEQTRNATLTRVAKLL